MKLINNIYSGLEKDAPKTLFSGGLYLSSDTGKVFSYDSGTGKAATSFKGCGAGLSSCVATGAYFHDKLVGDVATSGVLPPSDFNQLQPWQREALSKSSPTAVGALKGTSTGCGATAAVAKTVNTAVPGTWGSLGSTNNSSSQNNLPSGWGGLGS